MIEFLKVNIPKIPKMILLIKLTPFIKQTQTCQFIYEI